MTVGPIPVQAVPSRTERTRQIAPGSTNLPIPAWPKDLSNKSVDAGGVATKIIGSLNLALDRGDNATVAKLFLDDGYWRDHLCLTWDLRTMKGSSKIKGFLDAGHNLKKIEIDRSTPERSPKVAGLNPKGNLSGIQFFTTVTTNEGSGRGLINLVEESGDWKIFTCFTTLSELTGFEEATGHNRAKGVQHGAMPSRKNWLDRRKEEIEFQNRDPEVLIIGCGQAGLTVHARLKMIGVPTLIVDACDEVGDNWRNRYHQLVLHDPIWYDQMPYLEFPKFWPIYTPKDKLAGYFKAYADLLELNIWTKTTIESTKWDEAKQEWTVQVRRQHPNGSVESRTLHPKHVVQATGHSGKKNVPDFPGWNNFKGDVICHSSEFKGAGKYGKGDQKGKKAIVVGSCNSAMDICQAFFEEGYDVTMVQRTSTAIIGADTIKNLLLGSLYSEDGPPIEDADMLIWGWPSEVFKAIHQQLTTMQVDQDKEILEGLEKAGFKVDYGPDDCGIFIKYFQRGGGYYFDVGSCHLIIDGKVKVKQGQEVSEILEHGIKFADGSELEADEIVVATGYQNMRTGTRQIFGDEVGDKVGDVWGFDEEGEMRTIWRQSGHPGLWLFGGNFAMCRYYSRIVALQIKAQLEGMTGRNEARRDRADEPHGRADVIVLIEVVLEDVEDEEVVDVYNEEIDVVDDTWMEDVELMLVLGLGLLAIVELVGIDELVGIVELAGSVECGSRAGCHS
ncbi:putative FAD/NAD(P)-binding domain-containing protein [Seiridium cardinale]|uniref:FAD/NAD(P)-binding domain-containing protein n=1 Tax=Seiridium cardinale TaxID=138064 RepID=A0ABR2XM82_9PEZI